MRSNNHEINRRELLLAFASTMCLATIGRRVDGATAQHQQSDMKNDGLPGWSESSRAIVRKSLSTGGRIAVEDVQSLAKLENSTVEKLMVDLLGVARNYSRPPLSNFHVGAVALGASGALYPGANIEMPGNALNQAVHAEQAALANAFAHQERGITAIAVTAAPCGHCRQFLNEISGGSQIRILVQGQASRTLGDLLPASFGPADLGITTGLFSSPSTPLVLVTNTRDELVLTALKATERAYAPHTKSLAGCSVLTRSGKTYAGSYLENAAFNPSLSPLQAALVNVAIAGEEFADITRVVLVEMRGAAISQRPATEAVLKALSPRARLQVFAAQRAHG